MSSFTRVPVRDPRPVLPVPARETYADVSLPGLRRASVAAADLVRSYPARAESASVFPNEVVPSGKEHAS